MLKIKNGKLYGLNYSFALPEGFNLVISSIIPFGEELEFMSDDRSLVIKINFNKKSHSTEIDTQGMFYVDRGVLTSNFFQIKRGKGIAVGYYIENEYFCGKFYGERYSFKKNKVGETQLDIEIILWDCIRERMPLSNIQEALKLPNVKAFLESIEYH